MKKKEKDEKVTLKKEKEKKEVKKVKKTKKEKKESFLSQVYKEMKLVHFPNRKDMIKYSVATICFVIFFGVYFAVIQAIMALVTTLQ